MRLPASRRDDLSTKPVSQAADQMHAAYLRADEEALRNEIARYYSMISSIDANVGRLMQALQAGKPQRPTMVVYATDNGWLWGEHQLLNKGAAMYEELIRTPFIVSCPGRFPPGKTSDALISTMDLFPTFANLAAAPPPPGLRGVDLTPLLEGRAKMVREELYFEYDKGETDNFPMPMLAIMTQRFKLNRYLMGGEEELYDLTNDPSEMINLGSRTEFAEERNRLRERLDSFKGKIEIPYWELAATTAQSRPADNSP